MKLISNKPFYFLRHGQTDYNLQHKTMGSKDIPLNSTGLSQAIKVAQLLKNEPISTIVTSPLVRATKTAKIIAEYIKAPIIEISELKEACWGEKEGTVTENNLWIKAWQNGEEIEKGEPYSIFSSRIFNGLNKALKHQGPVLIVSHGIVYWVIQEILRLPIIDISNATPYFHRPPEHPNHPWSVYPLSERSSLYD